MLKTGIQNGILYDDGNFEWGLEVVKHAGFDCIDFNIDTKLDYASIRDGGEDLFFTQSDEALKEYYQPQKDAMAKAGITMSQMHGPFPVYVPGNEKATDILLKATEKCLMLCEFFNCPYLVVHPYTVQLESEEKEREINLFIYKSLVPAAKKYGVGICLENMFKSHNGRIFGGACADAADACAYIDELNSFAGEKIFSFCFDLGHATLCARNIRRDINLLGERLTVLHIHDNDGIRDNHVQPYSQKRGAHAGYVTDWEGFIGGLKDIDFKGVLSFETFAALYDLPKELYPVMVNYVGGVAKYFAGLLSPRQNEGNRKQVTGDSIVLSLIP